MSVLERLDAQYSLQGYRRFHGWFACPRCAHELVVDIYWPAKKEDPTVLIHHLPGDPPTHRPEIVEGNRHDRRAARRH